MRNARRFCVIAIVAVAPVLACGGGGGGGGSGSSSSSGSGSSPYVVDMYDPSRAYNGTTFFPDSSDSAGAKIVEVDMNGNVVWEYAIPDSVTGGAAVQALDAEYLADTRTVLYNITSKGIYEISYTTKALLWSYETAKVSHDADRVYVDADSDGDLDECILFNWGMADTQADAQARIVRKDTKAEVWSWRAGDHVAQIDASAFNPSAPDDGSWTHANAVTLLPSGSVLISLRDFHSTVVVDFATGNVLSQFVWGVYGQGGTDVDPHEPEWIAGATPHVVVALQNDSPYHAVEIEWPSGTEVWTYAYPNNGLRTTRDADRLPNGNTLLQAVLRDTQESVLVEVTPSKEIVWRLRLAGVPAGQSPGHFYKAQRVGP